MAVWLTHRDQSFAVDEDVIRCADFAALTEADRIVRDAEAAREQILEDAHAKAALLLEQTQGEIERMVTEARTMLYSAQEVGLNQGMSAAHTQWASNAIDRASNEQRQMHRHTERLSQLVSMAVERIIDQEDRSSLYRRSLRTVLKLVQDTPMLTIRVHTSDVEPAREAVQSLRSQMPAGLNIDIQADPSMDVGACRFESDEGVIDTSLDTQLSALRSALNRTFAAMSEESVFDAPEDPAH